MPVPQVVIIGRPNVGKSSILNWMAGRRISIVDDKAGVTRDRVTYLMEERDRFFELVDTGGIGIVDDDNLGKQVEEQIESAIESADVILFVVDTRDGLMALDEQVAKRLRYVDKPIICVANKADADTLDSQADEFYKLGRGKLVKVSTQQNRNKHILLNMILERLPEVTAAEAEAAEDPVMKIAIVGRRNKSVKTDIDFYSLHRAQRSIRRADVVLLFFDCTQRLSKVDKQLCQYIGDNFRPCIFVVNKWDLLYGQMPTERWVTYLRENFPTMWHVPIAFITGETGKNVKALLNHAQMLFKQSQDRVSTSVLNRLIRAAMKKTPPPLHGSFRPKVYYATQVGTQPPTLVLMCNEPKAFQPTYRRYLLSVFRDYLKFGEVPIKLYLKKRGTSDRRDEVEPEVSDDVVVASHKELMAAGENGDDDTDSVFSDSGDVLAMDGSSDNVLDEGEQ